MTPARKTTALLALAGAVTGAALLLPSAPSGAGVTRTEPPPPAAQAPGLRLDAQLASSRVLIGDSDTDLAVTLTAGADADAARPAVDIAIVLDRSGSMDGDKLAQAKLAAADLISALEPRDRFALVAYGSDVEVLLPTTAATPAAVDRALATVRGIYTDGGTNLSGGLTAGAAQLAGERRDGAVARVVLISDGQANEGIVEPAALAELAASIAAADTSITTLGLGLDFDERSMTRIAVAGRGNYYFADSAAQLSGLFSRELGRLGKTVATEVALTLTPAPGVDIVEAYGYQLRPSPGGATTVMVSDLYAGETRKVVLRLRVSAERAGERPIAQVSAAFTRVETGARAELSRRVAAYATADADQVLAYRDADANRHIERARMAVALEEATILYEQGQRERAAVVLGARKRAVQKLAAELGDESLATELEGVADEAERDFAAAPPSSSAGKRGRKANRSKAYQLKY